VRRLAIGTRFYAARVNAGGSSVPHRAPGSPGHSASSYLTGKAIQYYRPRGSAEVRQLIDGSFQAFNAGRLSEACHIFADKMLAPDNETTIGLTVAGALTPAGLGGCAIELMERGLIDFIISTGANLYHDLHYALNFTLHRGSPFLDDVELYDQGIIRIYDVLFPATVLLETDSYIRDFLMRSELSGAIATSEFHYRLGRDLIERQPGCEAYSVVACAAKAGVPIYTSSPGDSSIGMNIAYHELMNGSSLMIDPNRDVNEICAIILAGKKNGCVILGGGSPKNFYLQGQPTLWEVYGIPKGGNDYFIQITTDQVVWGGLSGATPSEAVSWGKVNPGVLPDTVVAYCDSTIAFPLFCEYVVGSENNRRPLKALVHRRDELIADLLAQAKSAQLDKRPDMSAQPAEIDRHR
jgi:deoxyhypusine synthase